MLTPAAKKRRVEAANATLRKPFRSPLINRPKAEGEAPSTTPSATTPKTSHGSSSRPSTLLRYAKDNAAEDEESGDGGAEPVSLDEPAALASSPERTHKRVKPLGQLLATSYPRVITTTKTTAATAAATSGVPEDSPTALGALLVGFEKHLAEVDARLRHDEDLRRQAERIVAASERRQPGGAVDAELVALIAKWKGASQVAAEEVFDLVKGRVDASGGAKAWKRMRQRQEEFFAGGDADELSAKGKRGEGDGEGCDGSDVDLYGSEKGEDQKETTQAGGDEADDDDGSDEEFTMLMMLRSLNIDPKLLGYNEAEDRWDD